MKKPCYPRVSLVLCALATALLSGSGSALLATCGPFTDTAGDAFCPFVLEIFYQGITTGTTATTYSPGDNVTRLQMAAFLSRTVDSALRRAGPRAAAGLFWTPQNPASLGVTTLDNGNPGALACDGSDVWAANLVKDTVSRVRASDGKLLETWTGATFAAGVLIAIDGVFVTGGTSPGRLYRIVSSQPAGSVTTVASILGDMTGGLAFDGARIWTAAFGSTTGSVSIVTPGPSIPWTVTTVTTGFANPLDVLYDGSNIWVLDNSANALRRVDSAGAVLQTVTVGSNPSRPVFDGSNIWVPNNFSSSVSVIRAATGTVLATLTGNGLNGPIETAFDGQRVLVTNNKPGADSVSLFKAADFSIVGVFPTGAGSAPGAATSDGLNFWITLQGTKKLARF